MNQHNRLEEARLDGVVEISFNTTMNQDEAIPHVVFLDVDGTIIPFDAPIPQTAIDAIRMARQNGNKVLLCTGRSRAELQQPVMEIGFDGMVGGAGSFVDIEGKNVFLSTFPALELTELLKWFEAQGLLAFYQSHRITYAHAEAIELFHELLDTYGEEGKERVAIPGVVPVADLHDIRDITKIFFFSRTDCVPQVRHQFGDRFCVINNTVGLPLDICGELSQSGITKASGMQVALDYLHCKKECSIAMGDGYNDLEMIDFAQVGIAMGNAVEALKTTANYITDDIHDNGLYNAFLAFGLINAWQE